MKAALAIIVLLLSAFHASMLSAAESWTEYRSGPFHIYTDAGPKPARDKLNYLEQFRHALGVETGKTDMKSLWPIRIVMFKSPKQAAKYGTPSALTLGRDAWMSAQQPDEAFSRPWLRQCARILIDSNLNRIPLDVENGIVDLFATLQITGTHITIGEPLPAEERNKDWARMQLLATDPSYSGRTRVMIYNFEQGSDADTAMRNAFEKSAKQIETQVDAYFAAGQFPTGPVSGRALSAAKDTAERAMEPELVQIALADLLLANRSNDARAAYEALRGPDASEGLGLIALAAKRASEAQKQFSAATAAGSKSARAWFELGMIETDPAKARDAFSKAVPFNPRWAAPHYQMAQRDEDQARKTLELKTATTLEPRNSAYWQALAEAYLLAKDFPEAGKAWTSAEKSSLDEKERARIHQLRMNIEDVRTEAITAEKGRVAAEKAADLQRVRDQMMSDIHQAEAKANAGKEPLDSKIPVVDWWEGPQPDKTVRGLLDRVECPRGVARMVVIGEDGTVTKLLMRDPSRIMMVGGGEKTLACGPQKPPQKVKIEYLSKPDAKSGTVGEAASVEFP